MIADVIGNYLDNMEEREFDAPFISLLRGLHFTDIHFMHGAFEFGKDFIAKGYENEEFCQFAFQTKAGDLNLQDWNLVRGQLDLLRTNCLAHPAFDRQMPRRAVLVTTGRLIGGAALAAQEYSEHLKTLGEIGFSTWDRETLIQLISETPEIGLTSALTGPLLGLLGAIDQNQLLELGLEEYSRRWCTATVPSLCTSALEGAVVANRLRRQGRLDLACYATLCLIRASWTISHGSEPPESLALLVANTGRSLFRHYARDLLDLCDEDTLDPLKLIHAHEPHSAHVTYPARCLRLVEILSLLALLDREEGVPNDEVTDFITAFLRHNPGAAHPISDRWAVSLIPPLLVLQNKAAEEELIKILKNVIRWVCDRYDSGGLGLAGPYSNPDDEVSYLLGSPFEDILPVQRRSDSYVAAIVLDVAALLRLRDLFELAINDFRAVGLTLPVIEAEDVRGQYLIGGDGLTMNPNIEYSETWAPRDGWKVAPHHYRSPHRYYLERIGRPWDHLAVSAVLRDRYFLPACLAQITSVESGT